MIWAVAGTLILTDLWEKKRGSTVISVLARAARTGIDSDHIYTALGAGIEAGVVAPVSIHHSGAKRYRLVSLKPEAYVDALERYGEVINSLVETVTGERPSFLSLIQTGDLDVTGEWWRERMERKAREAAEQAPPPSVPRGPMRNLDPSQASRVAAELLLTADSPVWRGNGSSASLWLGMLRGVLGLPVSKHATEPMVKDLLGNDVFDRLNAGEPLSAILSERISPEVAERGRQRLAEWSARSSEIREASTMWEGRKNTAEPQLTTWLDAVPAPHWTDSTPEERFTFIEALRATIPAEAMTELTRAFYKGRLMRRLTKYRGWEREAAGLAAREVFPAMPKMKTQARGVVVSAPVEVNGVLV